MMANTPPASAQPLCSTLWSTLPSELQERILAHLPFPFLFRLRPICHRWNSLPHCPSFRSFSPTWTSCLPVLFSKSPTPKPQDHGWSSDSWSAYNANSNTWLHLPPLTCLHPRHPKPYLVVGTGGLLCIGDFDSEEPLVVCNPVTKAFRELPKTLGMWTEPDLTAMVVVEEGYKVVLAGNRSLQGGYRRTEVYESAVGKWIVGGEIPEFLELHSQEGALCGNSLFCLARDPKEGVWSVLVAFDVERRVWSVVDRRVPCGRRTPHVVACGGRVLAVAEHEDPSECAILFELDLPSKKWREHSRLPHEMYVAIGKRVVACTVDGDYICVTGCSANRWSSVMYRWSERQWHSVPPFPIEDGSKGGEVLLSSSPFRPSLEPV